ncbi:putative nuclease HARBI1 [Anoplophora glabripennis]|uniref:putative nuclease HARBI1 n=1 Tax=Anoplophora glabripennis TaxID=217634 RepID=UPI0008734EA7|nr:putative nuclease HARBI1 [Anoplophora glabripennis]
MDASTFRRRFRLSKETVHILVQIEDQLEYRYDLNNCVSPINQLLVTLRLYSTGGHLDLVADFAGMHLSTVSRIIVRVSEAIANLSQNYVSMPTNINSIRATQQNFYDVANFPRVIGAVDGTHCRIISPGGDDPEVFRNRKGYFSINAQFVCDSRLKILNVVARWPGSTHDSPIFNNSRLKMDFENNQYQNCLLLGMDMPIKHTY